MAVSGGREAATSGWSVICKLVRSEIIENDLRKQVSGRRRTGRVEVWPDPSSSLSISADPWPEPRLVRPKVSGPKKSGLRGGRINCTKPI